MYKAKDEVPLNHNLVNNTGIHLFSLVFMFLSLNISEKI